MHGKPEMVHWIAAGWPFDWLRSIGRNSAGRETAGEVCRDETGTSSAGKNFVVGSGSGVYVSGRAA